MLEHVRRLCAGADGALDLDDGVVGTPEVEQGAAQVVTDKWRGCIELLGLTPQLDRPRRIAQLTLGLAQPRQQVWASRITRDGFLQLLLRSASSSGIEIGASEVEPRHDVLRRERQRLAELGNAFGSHIQCAGACVEDAEQGMGFSLL